MKSVVGEKGQVTIPKRLRDDLGISAGVTLDFSEERGRLVARKVEMTDPLVALVGLLPKMDVDAALGELRGPAFTPKLDGAEHAKRRR